MNRKLVASIFALTALAGGFLLSCKKSADAPKGADAALRAEAARLGIAPQPLRRVIFIGVDGADWEIIQPLMQRGRLPHFAQIVHDGATGDLKSIEPMLSPLLCGRLGSVEATRSSPPRSRPPTRRWRS